ncbi:MAG: tetratricopeptide repeat protein [Proteobacteria bacterium]|nr:tetratricopeptide repeat protein [Pseudomonadota bacterium]MBU1711059.1 tetratricopeptide repeat protein [Pseudomonadota bacterium]
MSKLFNTLEKIRKNETYHVSSELKIAPVSRSSKKRRTIAFIAVFSVFVISGTYLFLSRQTLQNSSPKSKAPQDQTTSSPAEQKVILSSPASTVPETIQSSPKKSTDETASLNNLGVDSIRRQKHWDGIYSLHAAVQADPQRIEPLINLGIALSELGLHGPAAKYFSQAYNISPKHPGLQKNLAILSNAGLLDAYKIFSGNPKLRTY